MQGKKGLEYIDWSISFGIFIIAVIALFVFLKPATKPQHDADNLITIVEQGFLKDTTWYLHQTPLYVKRFADKAGSPPQDALLKVKASGDITLTHAESKDLRNYEQPIRLSARTLELNCKISCDNTQFLLTGTADKPQASVKFEVDCTPPASCSAVMGATETFPGLNQDLLNRLTDYSVVKSAWHYPAGQDFALYRDSTKLIGAEEPKQANIFVKELRTNLVTKTGAQTPVTISIRVW